MDQQVTFRYVMIDIHVLVVLPVIGLAREHHLLLSGRQICRPIRDRQMIALCPLAAFDECSRVEHLKVCVKHMLHVLNEIHLRVAVQTSYKPKNAVRVNCIDL